MGKAADLTVRVIKHFIDPMIEENDSQKIIRAKKLNTYLTTALEISSAALYFTKVIDSSGLLASLVFAETYRNSMNYILNSEETTSRENNSRSIE